MVDYLHKPIGDFLPAHVINPAGDFGFASGTPIYDALETVYLNFNAGQPQNLPVPPGVLTPPPPLIPFATRWQSYVESKSETNPFPPTWARFLSDWRIFADIDLPRNRDPYVLEVEDATIGPAVPVPSELTGFATVFREAILADTTNDWDDVDLMGEDPDVFFAKLAGDSFGALLARFPYAEYPLLTSADPITEWEVFLTQVAVNTEAEGATIIGAGTLPSLERIYKAYIAEDGTGFDEALTEFVAKMQGLRLQGHFNPSHHIDEWMEQLIVESKRADLIVTSEDEILRRNIMFVIFDILAMMLDSLQETIGVQASRLSYLTEFQVQYTELMGRVHLYSNDENLLLGPDFLWHDPVALNPIMLIPSQLNIVENGANTEAMEIYDAQHTNALGRDLSGGAGDTVFAVDFPWTGGIPLDTTLDVDLPQNGLFPPFTAEFLAEGGPPEGILDIYKYQSIRMDQFPGYYDAKGFAGITLREIDEAGIPAFMTNRRVTPGSLLPPSAMDAFVPHFDADGVLQPYPGVHWFVTQPYGVFGDDWGGDEQEKIGAINSERNQWIEQLRTRRSILKDEAKQAQTDLSGTKEAINQQANFMSSIIQLLSGLLQSVFK